MMVAQVYQMSISLSIGSGTETVMPAQYYPTQKRDQGAQAYDRPRATTPSLFPNRAWHRVDFLSPSGDGRAHSHSKLPKRSRWSDE